MENHKFYKGQEVICVESHKEGCVRKGNKYIVESVFLSCHGTPVLTLVGVLNPDYEKGTTARCLVCCRISKDERMWALAQRRFAPIQEKSYPEEFDSKELLINKRIDLIEKILKERLQQTEFKMNESNINYDINKEE